jgi:septum formation protein
MQLVLASTSPRRREILALLRIPFDVVAPEFDEVVTDQVSVPDEVVAFGRGKAESVRYKCPGGATIIGSDTMIALDDQKIGKPADNGEARRMLAALAGRRHTIFTGVVILDATGLPALQTVETVDVDMRSLSEKEIDAYVATGESLDKAGAYSIQGQGGRLIRSIRGDYLAAVGLPLRPIGDYLARIGVQHADIDAIYAGKNFRNWRAF